MAPRGLLPVQSVLLAALLAAACCVDLDGLDGLAALTGMGMDPLRPTFGDHGQAGGPLRVLPPPLRLTPLLEAGNAAEARARAAVPPLLPACCTSYAGFLTVDKRHDSNLFFWFFRSEMRSSTAPLIVWLQVRCVAQAHTKFLRTFLLHAPTRR